MDENLIIKDTLKGLVESAMKEGDQQILNWLISKIQPSYPKLYDDIMKYATESSYYEDKDYKPNDLVKQYAKQYIGPLEEQADDAIDFKAGSPEHLAYIEKQHPGTMEKWLTNKLTKKPKEEKHFGEEQMADLRNLLNGVQGVM